MGEKVKIADQVAIVTGGGSGLGRAVALALARKGAKILIAEVRESEGKKVLKEIQALGGAGEIFVGDLSQEKPAKQMVDSCLQRLKGLDILINNAGLRMEEHADSVYESWRCLKMRPTHELPVEVDKPPMWWFHSFSCLQARTNPRLPEEPSARRIGMGRKWV